MLLVTTGCGGVDGLAVGITEGFGVGVGEGVGEGVGMGVGVGVMMGVGVEVGSLGERIEEFKVVCLTDFDVNNVIPDNIAATKRITIVAIPF